MTDLLSPVLAAHVGSATQREACKVVQALVTANANMPILVHCGVLSALSVLARSDSIAKKHVAATMLQRFALDADCRRTLLQTGGARTLCALSRTLARKVVRPAVSALCTMSRFAPIVPGLLDAGAGRVLAALASSSDPELRQEGCKALADMLAGDEQSEASSRLQVADQLLSQGALPVFFAASYSRDRMTQLDASRGLMYFACCSPTHARIIARKGAARPLSALVHGREAVLANAIEAMYELARALTSQRAPIRPKNLLKVRGVLEVGVVGSPKELWARLNDDDGRPAAKIMSVARSHPEEHLKHKAQQVLHLLKPDILGLVLDDLPQEGGYAPEAVASRHFKALSVLRIQRKFRLLVKSAKAGPSREQRDADERRQRLGFGSNADPAGQLKGLGAAMAASRLAVSRREREAQKTQAEMTRGLTTRELNALNAQVAAGIRVDSGGASKGPAPRRVSTDDDDDDATQRRNSNPPVAAAKLASWSNEAAEQMAGVTERRWVGMSGAKVSAISNAAQRVEAHASARRNSMLDSKVDARRGDPIATGLSSNGWLGGQPKAPPQEDQRPKLSLAGALNLPGGAVDPKKAVKGGPANVGSGARTGSALTPRPPDAPKASVGQRPQSARAR